MNVPREIDELMWEIAESKDSSLQQQFVARYPSFALELEKRTLMVNDLKGSRPTREPALFVPSREVRNFGPSRSTVAATAVMLIASVTFATYATTKYFNSHRVSQPIAPITRVPSEPTSFEKTPVPDKVVEAIPQSNAIGALQPENVQSQRNDPYLNLISVKSEKTTISDVIREIASQAGLTVTLAPGYEDKMIFILYEDQPAIGVLNDLGRKYGFTVFPQGKGEILIVPARGSGSINEIGASGVANELSSKESNEVKNQ